MKKKPVHLWLPDGTIACRGLMLADMARPLPDAPEITIYPEIATCATCLAVHAKRLAS